MFMGVEGIDKIAQLRMKFLRASYRNEGDRNQYC